MNKCNYDCFRKEHMPFEPKKWKGFDNITQKKPVQCIYGMVWWCLL